MHVEAPRPYLVAAWAIALAGAIACTFIALDDGVPRRELSWMLRVQDWPFPGDTLSEAVRALTDTSLVVVLGCLLSAGLFVLGYRREAIVLLVLIFVLPFAQSGLKNLIDRARPTPELVDVRGAIGSESFPAGHVMSPTVLYGYVIWLCIAHREWPAVLRIAAIAFSAAILALTGLVNVWLGVHWPTDVIGAYLWGLVLLLPAIWLAQPQQSSSREA